MNIPLHSPLLEKVNIKEIVPKELLLDLSNKGFSGFIYLSTHTDIGFNESIIILSKGDIVGCIFLNDHNNIEVYGKVALDLSFGLFSLKKGILSIYKLSKDQIKLLLIFNEKINVNYKITKKDISKIDFKYKKEDILRLSKLDFKNYEKQSLFEKFRISDLLRE